MPTIYSLLKNNADDVYMRLNASGIKRIYNLSIAHLALLLSFHEKPFIVVEDSAESAFALYNDLLFFEDLLRPSPIAPLLSPAVYFPPRSGPESIGERANVLLKFNSTNDMSIITSKEACETGFVLSEIKSKALSINKGSEMARENLDEWLKNNGYKNVSVVVDKGEYSWRGWLCDIFPVTENSPVRIEFYGDEIDLIRAFDIETQISTGEIQALTLLPAAEDGRGGNLIDDISGYMEMNLFIHSDIAHEFEAQTYNHETVAISHRPFVGDGIDSLEIPVKGLGILPEERKGIDDLPQAISNAGPKVITVLPSRAQAERLNEIMFSCDIVAPIIKRQDLYLYDGDVCITAGKLSSGINIAGLMILTDIEIFGERPPFRPIKKSKAARLLLNIDDLKPGDFVVHKDRGVGRFNGLQRQRLDGYEEDLISIEYANGRLYVPFHSIDKLKKYSAGEGHIPALNTLGGKSWLNTKKRVKQGIREMADKLLKLYAERKVARGFVFSPDTPMHREFDDFFTYEETPDQLKSIEGIKERMHSGTPMDMLICGDVGYGKTEVAMRAVFRAVFDGKQVAVLVPTTLLAEQHFRTFTMRFSAFPVKIDSLSRFKNREAVKKTLKAIADGETDIVIGTHMLLNKKVVFRDLGLLIIDEEHRFGVAQKERLKELKKGVDVLTLTATPIPRTLQISLSGIREMTSIETPPEDRLAVRSIVTVFSIVTIKEAIGRELGRGGQVFFVHNRIKDIDKMSGHIREAVPNARVATAHGRMRETELERIMLDFLSRKTDILVCTAIIGSGLDITAANTIIVNRADTFGLADLYQLKGRVGRGNIQAFAYFLIPGENMVTEDAKKRLQAIQEMSYLGAGFRLALKDLEIRGAGNLLGPEQSGYINGVGFDMYMEMLENAVSELKGEEIKEEFEPQVSLRLSAFIPEDYIPDITLRLSVYKRIASAKSLDTLSALYEELPDRFGSMPGEVKNLLHIVKIKLLSKNLYITKITDMDKKYRFLLLIDSDNKYKIPEDFFDRLMKILFSTSVNAGIRFLPDGFEMDVSRLPSEDRIKKVEETLNFLAEKLKIS